MSPSDAHKHISFPIRGSPKAPFLTPGLQLGQPYPKVFWRERNWMGQQEGKEWVRGQTEDEWSEDIVINGGEDSMRPTGLVSSLLLVWVDGWGRVDGWFSEALHQKAIGDVDISHAGVFLGCRQDRASTGFMKGVTKIFQWHFTVRFQVVALTLVH